MSNGISCSFTNFNSCTVEIWEWIRNFIPNFICCKSAAHMKRRTDVLATVVVRNKTLSNKNKRYLNIIEYSDDMRIWSVSSLDEAMASRLLRAKSLLGPIQTQWQLNRRNTFQGNCNENYSTKRFLQVFFSSQLHLKYRTFWSDLKN